MEAAGRYIDSTRDNTISSPSSSVLTGTLMKKFLAEYQGRGKRDDYWATSEKRK
jgi:hypothetical protein